MLAEREVAGHPALPHPTEVIRRIRSRRPDSEFINPDYDGYCITNIAGLVLHNFGLAPAPPECLAPLAPRKYSRIVLLIVDALGYHLLDRAASHIAPVERVLERSRRVPVTVTFPSTTTVALTSIYTGLTPLEHGITGHMMFLRDLGGVADILRFSPLGDRRRDAYAEQGKSVRELFPMRTMFEPLREAGFATLSITRAQFRDTALGLLHHAGADVVGYLDLADLLTLTRDSIRERRQPGLICVYWDSIDMLSHEYKPSSDAVQAAIAEIFAGLEREVLTTLTPEERADTLLLITADHGQVDTYPEDAIYLREHPDIVDSLLLPPAGQSRAPYLYGLPRSVERLPEQLRQFEGQLEVTTSWQALGDGLFGPPALAANVDTRVGDVIAFARGGSQLLWTDHDRQHMRPGGRHGSLSEEEMLVPLIALSLEDY